MPTRLLSPPLVPCPFSLLPPSLPLTSFPRNSIWSLNISPKENFSFGDLARKSFLTKIISWREISMCFPFVLLCNEETETTSHCLAKCKFTTLIWFASSLSFRTVNDNDISFLEWIKKLVYYELFGETGP